MEAPLKTFFGKTLGEILVLAGIYMAYNHNVALIVCGIVLTIIAFIGLSIFTVSNRDSILLWFSSIIEIFAVLVTVGVLPFTLTVICLGFFGVIISMLCLNPVNNSILLTIILFVIDFVII